MTVIESLGVLFFFSLGENETDFIFVLFFFKLSGINVRFCFFVFIRFACIPAGTRRKSSKRRVRTTALTACYCAVVTCDLNFDHDVSIFLRIDLFWNAFVGSTFRGGSVKGTSGTVRCYDDIVIYIFESIYWDNQ